jgi:hypothetical protein
VRKITKTGKVGLFSLSENALARRTTADRRANPSVFSGLGSRFAAAHRMVAGFVDLPTVNAAN